jgi:Lon protease-like protein
LHLTLPVFPLNTVLYPGGLLPLKIFEQRYLDMTKACLRDATPFGVCRIREGREVGLPKAHPVAVPPSSLNGSPTGVFHLQVRGQQPFRILQQTTQADGLIRAEIELLEESAGAIRPESFSLCRRVLEQIIEKIGADYFSPPLAYDDPRWTSYRLAEMLPLDSLEKQGLLEMCDDGARLQRLHAYLTQSA